MFDLGVKRNWKSLKRWNVCVQNYIIPVVLWRIWSEYETRKACGGIQSWHGPRGYIALPGPIGMGAVDTYRGKIYRFRVLGYKLFICC